MFSWYNKKNMVLSKKIGDHKLYTTKDLILATRDHLVTMVQESQRKS